MGADDLINIVTDGGILFYKINQEDKRNQMTTENKWVEKNLHANIKHKEQTGAHFTSFLCDDRNYA